MSLDTQIDEAFTRLQVAVFKVNSWEDPYVELYTRGVTGVPMCGNTCILAEYLSAQTDGDEVNVFTHEAQSFIGYVSTDIVSFAPQVVKFIREFDAGRYPELVTNNAQEN